MIKHANLITVQLDCRAGHIASLSSPSARHLGFNSFEKVEQTYTDEIFGGRLARHYDAVLNRIIPDASPQARLLRLMSEGLNANERLPASYWRKHAGLAGGDFEIALDARSITKRSSIFALIRCRLTATISSLQITFGHGQISKIDTVSRAQVVGETLVENVQRASRLMARHYRRDTAIGLRSLMPAFDGRHVSTALIDYARFKQNSKVPITKKF